MMTLVGDDSTIGGKLVVIVSIGYMGSFPASDVWNVNFKIKQTVYI